MIGRPFSLALLAGPTVIQAVLGPDVPEVLARHLPSAAAGADPYRLGDRALAVASDRSVDEALDLVAAAAGVGLASVAWLGWFGAPVLEPLPDVVPRPWTHREGVSPQGFRVRVQAAGPYGFQPDASDPAREVYVAAPAVLPRMLAVRLGALVAAVTCPHLVGEDLHRRLVAELVGVPAALAATATATLAAADAAPAN